MPQERVDTLGTGSQPGASSPVAILFMAYGTPATLDDVEPFYTHIRGGRPPTPEMLAELIQRYKAIGGSPLARITRQQAQGVVDLLNRRHPSQPFRAFVGMKHSPPFIKDTVLDIAREGLRRVVGLTLTPQYSRLSVGGYISAVQHARRQAEGGEEMEVSFIESWHLHPPFIDCLARRVDEALRSIGATPSSATVLFTAHSLPKKILEYDDPYPRHLRETGQAVAERLGLTDWNTAYQSAGQTPIPWLGPDLLEELDRLAGEGKKAVVVCPAGFVADHLEVLYDIDIEARARAEELGLRFARTESLNDAPDFLEALASVLEQHLAEQLEEPAAR